MGKSLSIIIILFNILYKVEYKVLDGPGRVIITGITNSFTSVLEMSCTLYYIAVKSSLYSTDTNVFGLSCEEVNALSKKYGCSYNGAINGVVIKTAPIQLINSLSELGYKVVCCSGESELTWTMMSHCIHNSQNSSACQTLDELDFERGIWFAAQHNDVIKVKQWINKRDINALDRYGYTALHYASRNGHLEMCKLLISNGANVNALTRSGKVSPLHRCVSMGHCDVFKLLLDSGAQIDVRDGDGKTVLHRAVEGGHCQLVEKILKINPSLAKVTDKRGFTPKDCLNISRVPFEIFNKYALADYFFFKPQHRLSAYIRYYQKYTFPCSCLFALSCRFFGQDGVPVFLALEHRPRHVPVDHVCPMSTTKFLCRSFQLSSGVSTQ